ncbi:MAG TPA: TIGR03067 domain-containing protein [Gemmataceae bacterium]|nr:TIGR03067 domain-containing protein [Gemmataceae bacterium]
MKSLLISLSCVGLLTTLSAAQTPAGKDDMAKFQGKWRLVGGSVNGKKLGDAEAVAMDMMLSIKGDQIATYFRGVQKALLSFKIDPSKDPKEIDTVDLDGISKGVKSRGIYAIDGDTLKMTLRDKYNGRPGKFEVPEGVEDLYVIMCREKPPPQIGTTFSTRMLGYAVSPVLRAAVLEPVQK